MATDKAARSLVTVNGVASRSPVKTVTAGVAVVAVRRHLLVSNRPAQMRAWLHLPPMWTTALLSMLVVGTKTTLQMQMWMVSFSSGRPCRNNSCLYNKRSRIAHNYCVCVRFYWP